MPSFEKMNYVLRPNKNVERKLIVEILWALAENPRFRLSTYRYVGFSSVYYADAVLFHKRLGIEDLVSIEREVSRKKRLDFNKPYACVKVHIGESSEVLPTLDWAKPQLVWLDYDGTLDMSMFSDAETVSTKLKTGDFLFVTVNAEVFQLDNVTLDGRTLTREEALRQVAPAAAIPPNAADRVTGVAFPTLIGEIWDNYLRSIVLDGGTDLRFLPLLNLTYADGAKMVTYGGILANDGDRKIIEDLKLGERLNYIAGTEQFKLAVPQLTQKEKLELDRLMPVATEPNATGLPFELKQTEVRSYWQFYRHYPIFGEFAP